jgi:hypothetical protein
MKPQHLVTVWNPRYAGDALEAHLRLLLDWDAKATAGNAGVEDVYVWWGKVRSAQRQQSMPHLEDIVALGADAGMDSSAGYETHLYITDYRSLYVADITGIVTDDPRAADSAHVPTYYSKLGLNCDCWFEIGDIRLIVKDDLEGVAAELAMLRNTRYSDRPVSLYGGMVDLPLLVARNDGRRFFDERERELFADGDLWARYDSEQGGVGALEAALREDHFGAAAWQVLEPSARRFIAMAEQTLRNHRRDPAADLTSVIVGYGKALEVQINALVKSAMVSASAPARRIKIESSTVILPDALPLTLRQLSFALGGETAFGDHLRQTLTDGGWLTADFAAILEGFAVEARNPAAHGECVSREIIFRWRDRLLGVGTESILTRLAKVQRKR